GRLILSNRGGGHCFHGTHDRPELACSVQLVAQTDQGVAHVLKTSSAAVTARLRAALSLEEVPPDVMQPSRTSSGSAATAARSAFSTASICSSGMPSSCPPVNVCSRAICSSTGTA